MSMLHHKLQDIHENLKVERLLLFYFTNLATTGNSLIHNSRSYFMILILWAVWWANFENNNVRLGTVI